MSRLPGRASSQIAFSASLQGLPQRGNQCCSVVCRLRRDRRVDHPESSPDLLGDPPAPLGSVSRVGPVACDPVPVTPWLVRCGSPAAAYGSGCLGCAMAPFFRAGEPPRYPGDGTTPRMRRQGTQRQQRRPCLSAGCIRWVWRTHPCKMKILRSG